MNYISFLVLILAVTSVSAEEGFTGTRVVLSNAKMLKFSHTLLDFGFNETGKIKFEEIKAHRKIIILDFDLQVDKISKPGLSKLNINSSDTFENGTLNVIYTNPFWFNVSFHANASVQKISVVNNNGSANISVSSIVFTYDYNLTKPNITAKFVYSLDSVKFEGGFYTDAIVEIISTQFMKTIEKGFEKIKNTMIATEPLKGLEMADQPLDNGKSVSLIIMEVKSAQPKPKVVERNSSSALVYEKVEHLLTQKCISNKTVEEGKSFVCFCPSIFPTMQNISHVEETITPEKWELRGSMIELYEILPNLINYYSPDAKYVVTSKVINTTFKGAPNMTDVAKEYNFKIGEELVLRMVGTFSMEIAGKNKEKHLIIEQKNVKIEKLETDEAVQPAGRTVLARFMLYEIERMLNNPMFTKGLPLNTEEPVDAEFCVDITDK